MKLDETVENQVQHQAIGEQNGNAYLIGIMHLDGLLDSPSLFLPKCSQMKAVVKF